MTIQQYKKWLKQQRNWLAYHASFYEYCTFKNYVAAGIATEASQHAAELLLPDLMREWGEQGEIFEVDRYLVECLAGIPTGDVLSLEEAADYLGYSVHGLRKIKYRKEIQFSQKVKGAPIFFKQEWLDEFLATNESKDTNTPARAYRKAIEPQFGFDPELLS